MIGKGWGAASDMTVLHAMLPVEQQHKASIGLGRHAQWQQQIGGSGEEGVCLMRKLCAEIGMRIGAGA